MLFCVFWPARDNPVTRFPACIETSGRNLIMNARQISRFPFLNPIYIISTMPRMRSFFSLSSPTLVFVSSLPLFLPFLAKLYALVGKHRSRIMASDEANEAKPSQNSEPNNVSPFRCWFQQRLKLKVFKGIEFRIRIRVKVICWNELMRNNDRAISFLGENW